MARPSRHAFYLIPIHVEKLGKDAYQYKGENLYNQIVGKVTIDCERYVVLNA